VRDQQRPSCATVRSPVGEHSPPADDLRVITSAATLVEVIHPRTDRPALEWTLSRLVVEPVNEPIARHAAALLAETGLHGHKYAIDATLSAIAVAPPTRHDPDLRSGVPHIAVRRHHRHQGLILL
jgi:hypothetical protein